MTADNHAALQNALHAVHNSESRIAGALGLYKNGKLLVEQAEQQCRLAKEAETDRALIGKQLNLLTQSAATGVITAVPGLLQLDSLIEGRPWCQQLLSEYAPYTLVVGGLISIWAGHFKTCIATGTLEALLHLASSEQIAACVQALGSVTTVKHLANEEDKEFIQAKEAVSLMGTLTNLLDLRSPKDSNLDPLMAAAAKVQSWACPGQFDDIFQGR